MQNNSQIINSDKKHKNVEQPLQNQDDQIEDQLPLNQAYQEEDTTEQIHQNAMHKQLCKEIVLVLQELMKPTLTSEPIDIPENLSHSKRPRNKRKDKENLRHNTSCQSKLLRT